jgi:hypothetical protein
MAGIYSTSLAAVFVTDTAVHTIYTAPTTGTVVIRDITLICLSTGTNTCNLRLPGTVIIAIPTLVSPDLEYHKSCRIVMNPSDTLVYQAAGGDWCVQISGYVLD